MQTTPERIVFTRIRAEVERQLQDWDAPEEVHGFLTQHWARLMTDIFMAKGNQDPDWQAGWDTMNALLWSLAPKQGRKDTATLLRTLPSLLARLQEGCVAMNMPALERDVFFERLAVLHAAVARAGLHEEEGGALDGHGPLSHGDAQGEEDVDLSALPPPKHDNAPASLTGHRAEQTLPDLALGSRIKLRVGVEDKVMLLHWLSPMGGMYLFTNEDGLDALTLTKARLESKFRQGEARLIV